MSKRDAESLRETDGERETEAETELERNKYNIIVATLKGSGPEELEEQHITTQEK